MSPQDGVAGDRAEGARRIPGLRPAAAIVLAGAILLVVVALKRSALHTPEKPNEGVDLLISSKVEINRASVAEISVLPGIGPSLAARIVEDREAHGGFKSIDDLSRVPGIGPATTQRIQPYISFEPDETSVVH